MKGWADQGIDGFFEIQYKDSGHLVMGVIIKLYLVLSASYNRTCIVYDTRNDSLRNFSSRDFFFIWG